MFNKKDYYNEKVECMICHKKYIRSNLSAHTKTKYHQCAFKELKNSFSDKEMKLIKKLSKLSIDDIQRIASSDTEDDDECENDDKKDKKHIDYENCVLEL